MLKNMRTRNKEKNMKLTKRFFIVLLTLAVLASSFALSAFASEEPSTGVNCDSLLAYFEEDVIFGYDFAEGELDYADSLMLGRPQGVTQSFVSDESVPGGRYLKFDISTTAPKNVKSVYFNWNTEEGTEEFYLDTVLSADTTSSNYPKYVIVVDELTFDKVGDGNNIGVNLVTLDFKSGVITFVSGTAVDDNGNESYVYTEVEYALNLNYWYSVSLDYSAEGATLTVTNVADAADTVTISNVYAPFELVKNVRFGTHRNASDGTVLKLASVCAATGNARINVSNHQKGVEDEILKVYASYTSHDISIEDKLGVCDVVNKIVAYGFTSTNSAVNAAIKDIKLGSINLYANALSYSLEIYNSPVTYAEKRAAIDEGLEYATVLEGTDLSPASAEELALILSNISAVRAANSSLVAAEADSLAYIALLSEIGEGVSTDDYQLLLSYYDAASALTPDFTYEGMAAAQGIYNAIAANMSAIAAEAEAFIADLEHLGDTDRDFMDRYNHYLQFKDNVYENETYPGITEALERYNNVILVDILNNIGYAENFILYVDKANFSTYISAKEENIRIADGYAELCHPDFPGVAEAKVLREEVLAFIAEQKDKAAAYINAVNNLTYSSSLKEIEAATELQKTGNVLGVDGVTEANMKLEQISSSNDIKERYSKYFISLVESLESLESAEEIYSVLAEAKRAEGKANAAYAGVSEASDLLDEHIENYNNTVYFTNIEFVTATNVAANTAGVGTIANTVADYVIGLIPRLPEEDEE